MKLMTKLALTTVLIFAGASAQAGGFCGAGKITSIKEGGWQGNDFLIMIDYSVEEKSSMPYFNSGYIRFLATLDETRLNGIKALSYMGFSSGRTVKIYTSGSSCAFADDITIFAPGEPTT